MISKWLWSGQVWHFGYDSSSALIMLSIKICKFCCLFLIQDIQVTLRDEIKSACEYRPFEKCDYSSRIANEICCKKLEYVISQMDGMKQAVDEYHGAVWRCRYRSCR